MAVKQLVLRKKIEQRNALLNELKEQESTLHTRSAELEKAIEEASTDEEITIVEEEAGKVEAEQSELDEKKSKLENEIAELEGELKEIEDKEPKNNKQEDNKTEERNQFTGGESRMAHNKYETRSQFIERLNRPEVREFYATLANAAKDKRSLSGTGVTIPEVVINMIQQRLGDYSTLYREVNVEQLSGTGRIIMDGAIPEAIWTEMCDPVQELSSAFSQTEIDGFKVSGFMPVCNATLEDSMINLAEYIEGRLTMAIGKALDKAILVGQGAAQKQPLGIVTALASDADRNVDSDGSVADIVTKIGLIDDGEDGAPLGEIIAVMKRSLYYSLVVPQTYLPTADGKLVVQTTQSPRLPDGTRIVFNQYAPANSIVLGDFKKYMLGERRGVQLAVSDDVKFVEDQTVFKATARYDGKPVYNDYFVVVNITESAPAGA